mmetsp:Transcript_15071/g.31452  ORF Transcript_15071/g.31452 Transcript_15071/m.31452 type:complete len:293 (+) Transcript_15071:159-1037(+)
MFETAILASGSRKITRACALERKFLALTDQSAPMAAPASWNPVSTSQVPREEAALRLVVAKRLVPATPPAWELAAAWASEAVPGAGHPRGPRHLVPTGDPAAGTAQAHGKFFVAPVAWHRRWNGAEVPEWYSSSVVAAAPTGYAAALVDTVSRPARAFRRSGARSARAVEGMHTPTVVVACCQHVLETVGLESPPLQPVGPPLVLALRHSAESPLGRPSVASYNALRHRVYQQQEEWRPLALCDAKRQAPHRPKISGELPQVTGAADSDLVSNSWDWVQVESLPGVVVRRPG